MSCFFPCGALMLCGTMLRVALPASHGRQLLPTATEAPSASAASRRAPCFADDAYAALREAGGDGELASRSRTRFGICGASDGSPASPASALLQLAKETSANPGRGLEVLHPTGVLISEEDEERGTLVLTLDLPQSPLLGRSPALLLAFEGPPTGGNLDVTFTSQSLHPPAQTACTSGDTWYIMLTGKASDGDVPQKWRISVEAKSPDMSRRLKEILTGGRSGSNVGVVPLLLFSGERGTDTRYHLNSSPASSQTSFLCELERFLGDVLPQDHRESSPLQLDSLKSLPPLTLGLSSGDALLAGLINSSSVTVFSFRSRASGFRVHRGELAFSPQLLEELRRRLEAEAGKMAAVMREERVGRGAAQRLARLGELCVSDRGAGTRTGERQYRAFLLLKALQTVARAYEAQRGQRATRAGPDATARANPCGLKSLSVSLDKRLDIPNIININNCQGSCAYPLAAATNHAVLLNYHVEVDNGDERAPCCVPVAYEALQMVEVKDHGTEISLKPDMVAKECECR
ncbi:LOW QUALITY PROTEIN: muellerian-inhibiting factor [Pungitius pungitius]|uniref:LOW QUALITY PROTEIN: muellerian-inhibiting factor n=1 Tax=Pungitius pungitius TaxID=134920 RepID=UPI002E0D5A80